MARTNRTNPIIRISLMFRIHTRLTVHETVIGLAIPVVTIINLRIPIQITITRVAANPTIMVTQRLLAIIKPVLATIQLQQATTQRALVITQQLLGTTKQVPVTTQQLLGIMGQQLVHITTITTTVTTATISTQIGHKSL